VLGTIFPTPVCDIGEVVTGSEGEQFALFPPPPPPPCPLGVFEPPPHEIVPASKIKGNTNLGNLKNRLHSDLGGGFFDIVGVFLDTGQLLLSIWSP
jgi:hypothetical protein